MQTEMELLLQVGGIVVPCMSALAGLFVWGLRRMDRRFDEAAAERTRIDTQLGERCDRIETQLGERCDRIEERCDRIETQLGERCDRIEREFKERCDRIDERIDRLSDHVMSLSVELGKAQGAARAVVEAASG